MFSNLSSGAEDESGQSKSAIRVRKIAKRNKEGDVSNKPKISRLGAKAIKVSDIGETGSARKGVRRLGDGTKTPESSNVSTAGGSDSERSDRNELSSNRIETRTSIADDWNNKPVVQERWSLEEETDKGMWGDDKFPSNTVEPPCEKKHAYKCGPIDHDENPNMYSRLHASEEKKFIQNEPDKDAFKSTDSLVSKKTEFSVNRTPTFKSNDFLETIAPSPSQVPVQQPQSKGGWSLRGSWLASVSKSVASLTAQVSQNISTALDTTAPPNAGGDLRQLVSERLHDKTASSDNSVEDSPRKGRKYLHKAGIDEDYVPPSPIHEVQTTKNVNMVPSRQIANVDLHTSTVTDAAKKINKVQQTSTAAEHISVLPKLSDNIKPSPIQSSSPVEKEWDDGWGNDFEVEVAPLKKSINKNLAAKKSYTGHATKLDAKSASFDFLQQESVKVSKPKEKPVKSLSLMETEASNPQLLPQLPTSQSQNSTHKTCDATETTELLLKSEKSVTSETQKIKEENLIQPQKSVLDETDKIINQPVTDAFKAQKPELPIPEDQYFKNVSSETSDELCTKLNDSKALGSQECENTLPLESEEPCGWDDDWDQETSETEEEKNIHAKGDQKINISLNQSSTHLKCDVHMTEESDLATTETELKAVPDVNEFEMELGAESNQDNDWGDEWDQDFHIEINENIEKRENLNVGSEDDERKSTFADILRASLETEAPKGNKQVEGELIECEILKDLNPKSTEMEKSNIESAEIESTGSGDDWDHSENIVELTEPSKDLDNSSWAVDNCHETFAQVVTASLLSSRPVEPVEPGKNFEVKNDDQVHNNEMSMPESIATFESQTSTVQSEPKDTHQGISAFTEQGQSIKEILPEQIDSKWVEPEIMENDAEIEVEPLIVKRDMYKCGNENLDSSQSIKPELHEQPLQIAINEEYEEWKDWDQEMIVEASSSPSIITLQTPVTEMHMQRLTKSELPSPPYTTENQRVRGGRGSISMEEPIHLTLPDKSKKEMEERIRVSLSLEINKFYEQDSSNEWDESESELNDVEEAIDREKSWSTESHFNEGPKIDTGNDWLLSDNENTMKSVSSGLWMCVGTTPENSKTFRSNEEIEKDGSNIDKNNFVESETDPNELNDGATVDIEPVIIKKLMYKCGSEDEDALQNSTTMTHETPVLLNVTENREEIEEELISIVADTCQSVLSTEHQKEPSQTERISGREKNLEALLSVSETCQPALSVPHQAETIQTTDAWEDNWDSNQSISSGDSSPLPPTDPIQECHPDIRQPSKQKTVEECIQLLIRNREELSKKIEEKHNSVNLETEDNSIVSSSLGETTQNPVENVIIKPTLITHNFSNLPLRAESPQPAKHEVIVESPVTSIEFSEPLEHIMSSSNQISFVPANSSQLKTATSWEDEEEDLSFVVSQTVTPTHAAVGYEQEHGNQNVNQNVDSANQRTENEEQPEAKNLTTTDELGAEKQKVDAPENNMGNENTSDLNATVVGFDDGWGDEWAKDPLEQEDALIEVEPIVIKRDMYKCGEEEESESAVDLLESFESRKVEGSENKRPEPIGGASPDKEILSADPEETEDDWADWGTQENDSKESSKKPTESESNKQVESADPFEDDWGNNDWGTYEDSPIKLSKKSAETQQSTTVVTKEQEGNNWDDFNDNWEVEEEDIVVTKTVPNIESSRTFFKEPDPVANELQLGNVFEKLETKNQWNWKTNWGVSLITSASKNVASLTAQVSQNLTNALETGIVPNPEEMARRVHESRRHKTSESSQKSDHSSTDPHEKSPPETKTLTTAGNLPEHSDKSRKSSVESIPEPDNNKRRPKAFVPLKNIVTGVTQISSKVITGGLDTLEGIGKKTFTIIQENVPDVDRKVLSDILGEAKQENSPEKVKPKEKLPEFEILFDDHEGLVHLEALEILSKQSTIKLEMILTGLAEEKLEKMHETLSEIEELCELPEVSEKEETETTGEHSPSQLEDRLTYAVRDLDVEISFEELVESWKRTSKYLTREARKADAKELYEKGLLSLAEFTSLAMAKFHKLAELLCVADYHSTATEVDALVSLTVAYFWHVNGLATRFNKLLNSLEKSDDTNRFITNIFLEASNANAYIQRGFKNFLPILKIGAT